MQRVYEENGWGKVKNVTATTLCTQKEIPRFKKKKNWTLKHNGEGEKIDLIGTTEEHVLTTITQFHSTVVMNYIAFYGIICLYPEWMMWRNGLVNRRNMPYGILNKYRGCRFKIAYIVRASKI